MTLHPAPLLMIVGLAMIGVGAGWLFEIAPLLVVSLVIGGEELLETSVVAAALDAELRRRSGAAVS